ncbi:MAG TPA: uroporphyrinogen-III C-methyltransferase [Acidimicrobiales bacterium]|nr:uroporphyrinogen-III C-methyltransferase [Acidimicrobiales bacterium]
MTVHLVGAGPGDADLVTRRAEALLARADVVVHDRLVSREVLDLVRPGAALVDVGKTPGDGDTQESINQLLVTLGRDHDCVVRLKGGDPFVFGRGGEEVEALRAAGLAVEVVPGVSSVFAGPLLAGVPVTHRGLASGVTVVTATSEGGVATDFTRLADATTTLVVLMGVARRATIAHDLIAGGLDPTTPVAVIERASTDSQRTVRCGLAELASIDVAAPAVIVIGAVAGLDLGLMPSPLGATAAGA